MEARCFIYQGREIRYQLDRGNRKHCYLSIDTSGAFTLKVPLHYGETAIASLLNEKAEWILHKMNQQKQTNPPPLKLCSGEAIPVWGEWLKLTIVPWEEGGTGVDFLADEVKIHIPAGLQDERALVLSLLKREYGKRLEEYIAATAPKWQKSTGLCPEAIEIKWMKRSWGRCRGNRHISLNAQLAAYPKGCADYVLLHELCHLRQMNHSKAFWSLVGQSMPDADYWRNKLKNPYKFD